MTGTHVTPEDARHALWAVGDVRGYEPGGFTKALLEAYGKADLSNRQRLWTGFPGLIQAVEIAHTPDGRDLLEKIAEGWA